MVRTPAAPDRVADRSTVISGGRHRRVAPLSRDELGLIGLTVLAWAVAAHLGTYSEHSFFALVIACALVALALARPPGPVRLPVWIGAALALALASTQTLKYWDPSGTRLVGPEVVMLIAAGVAVKARHQKVALAALIALSGGVGAFVALEWQWGAIDLDVFTGLQGATSNLLHGRNPYDFTYPTPVPLTPTTWGDAEIHYPYGPLLPLLLAPARLLGDVRIMSVVGLVLVGAAVTSLAGRGLGRVSRIRVATIALAFPLVEPMVLFAWVDGLMMAGFCGWLALRRDHSRWAVLPLAAALTIKPTFVVALLPFLLWSRSARRESVVAGLGAAAFSLPFALATGVGAYYHDVIGVQVDFGTRYDALTLTSWLYDRFGVTALPGALGIVVAGAVIVMVALRRPSDVAELCYLGAFLSMVSFAFAKWAFLNYYFIPAVLLMLGLATRGLAVGPAGDVALPGPLEGLGRRLATVVPSRLRGASAQ